jgi:ferredoxin--NADP+ reductase
LEINELSGEPFKQIAKGTGKTIEIDCGILFRSIGYNGVPIEGVPFYDRWGTIPNEEGRILTEQGGNIVTGLYTAGWIKRGPSAIIGTNRACAVESVEMLLQDINKFPGDKAGRVAMRKILDENNASYINYPQWEKIEAAEVTAGEPKGKPREKLTRRDEMLAIANG